MFSLKETACCTYLQSAVSISDKCLGSLSLKPWTCFLYRSMQIINRTLELFDKFHNYKKCSQFMLGFPPSSPVSSHFLKQLGGFGHAKVPLGVNGCV